MFHWESWQFIWPNQSIITPLLQISHCSLENHLISNSNIYTTFNKLLLNQTGSYEAKRKTSTKKGNNCHKDCLLIFVLNITIKTWHFWVVQTLKKLRMLIIITVQVIFSPQISFFGILVFLDSWSLCSFTFITKPYYPTVVGEIWV